MGLVQIIKRKFQIAGTVPFDKTGTPFTSDHIQGTTEESARWSYLRWFAASPNSLSTAISAGGTLTLTTLSKSVNWLTGSGTDYSIVVPSALTIDPGHKYEIWNMTNEIINVKNGAGTILFQLGQFSYALIQLQTAGSVAGTWRYWQILASSVASGIINYNVTSDSAFLTTAITDTLITGFTVTPQAGTYAVWGNMDVKIVKNNRNCYFSIYKAGVQIANSERSFQGVGSNFKAGISNMTVINVNGSDVIDGRVRISSGDLYVYGRTLLLIRLGT